MKRIIMLIFFSLALMLSLTIGVNRAFALDAPVITSPTNNAVYSMADEVCDITWTPVTGATDYCYALWDVTDGTETLLTGGLGRTLHITGDDHILDSHVEENHRYKMVVRALDRSVTPSIVSSSDPVYFSVTIREYNSEITNCTIPTNMDAGYTYNVSITFKNTGSKTWTEDNLDRLVFDGYYNKFGIFSDRMALASGETIPSGASKTWNFTMTPDSSGEYYIKIRMYHNDTTKFGATQTYTVTCNPSDKLPYDAKIIGTSIPTDMKVGRSYTASITVQNTGTQAWSGTNVFGFCPTTDNTFPNMATQWINNEVVAAGGTKTFTMTIKCDTAQYYCFGWQMNHDGTAFGEEFDESFRITNVLATSLSLDTNGCCMTLDDEPLPLTATLLPADTTDKEIEWDTSKPSVATVSSDGFNAVVTPVGIGRTSIRVMWLPDIDIYDTCIIDVLGNVDATGISLNKLKLIMQATDVPIQLFATVTPSDATNKSVTWTSSNPQIATVSDLGLVSPVRNGYTTVKAALKANPNIYATCTVIIGNEDTSGPNVISTSPFDGQTNVALSQPKIIVNFDESVLAAGNYDNIKIICTTYNNAVVPLSSKSISSYQLTITRNGDWTEENTYRVTIPAGAVKDAVGNNIASDYVFSFSTTSDGGGTSLGTPAITQPSTDGTEIPLGVDGGFTVRWTAVAEADHYVVGIKKPGDSHYQLLDAEVYTNEYSIGYLLASLIAGHDYTIEVQAVRGSEITMGSRQITVVTAAPEILTPSQSTVDINNIDVSWEEVWAGALQDPDYKISFFDMTANQDVAGYTNKLISSTSFALPASAAVENHQYRATVAAVNNEVEGESSAVEFTVTRSGDLESPYVVSTVPANGGKATVALGKLTVQFNENILSGANISAITVARPGMSSLGVMPLITGNKLELTIDNGTADPFAAGYTYTATIPAGAVKDTAGNASTAHQFSFTIDASGDGTAPYVVSTNPADGQENVKPSQNITITFSEAVLNPGAVLISNAEYGDATNKTNQVLDAAGKVLTISRNDGGKWGTGLTYTLTIPLGNITDIAGNEMAGVYTFTFTVTSDGTAPTISSVSPANGAVDVPLNSALIINFSEPITLVGDPYQDYKIEIINLSNNGAVAFKAVASDKKVTLTRPDGSRWSAKTQYRIKIHPGAVKDAMENPYTNDQQYSFTTLAVPASASFTFYPSEPLIGQSVRFNASSSQAGSNIINSYNWDFGDGSSGTGITPSHIYNSAGTHTVKLTLVLDDNSTKTSSKTIAIGEEESIIEEVPGPQEEYVPVPGGVNPTTIRADQVTLLSDGRKQYRGNISINQYLKLDGTLIVDEVNLEMVGDGCLYVEASQGTYHGQIDLFKGGFTLNAETGDLLKEMGINKLQIAGLNVEIDSLRLLSNGVRVAGKLELPAFVGGAEVAIDNLQVVNNRVDYAGRIDLPTMKLGKSSLGLKDAYMEYDSTEKKFVGHGILEIPKIFGIEGKIGMLNARLEEVGFGLDGLNILIDSTGFFINRLYGELGGLAQPPLRISGQADITGGPKVADIAAIEGKNLTLTIDMSGNFSGSGILKLFNCEIADGGFNLDRFKGFSVNGNVNIADILEGDMDLTCDKNMNLRGEVIGNVQVPNSIPVIGGVNTSSAKASIHNAGINVDLSLGALEVGFWRKWTGECGPSGRINHWGTQMVSLANQRAMVTELTGAQVKTIMLAEDNSVMVPTGQSQVIIQLTWQEDQDTDFNLAGPNGEVLTPTNCPIDSLSANYLKDSSNKKAFYAIANPSAGVWTYSLTNTDITAFNVDIYLVDEKPALTFSSPEKDTVTSAPVPISWTCNAPVGAVLGLFYSEEDQIATGTLIADDIEAADGTFVWDTSAVQSGDYYLYAVLDDAANDPVTVWAPGMITIVNPEAPSVPQGLSVQAVNGKLNISWSACSDTDLEGYRIYLLDNEEHPLESVIVSNSDNSFEWNELAANQNYRVAISAIDSSDLESHISQVVSVWLPEAQPPSLNIIWPQEITSQALVTVAGTIENGASGVLYLNDYEYAIGLSGVFEESVELSYGNNQLLLVAKKPNGDAAQEEFECYYDPTPPQLTVNNLTQEMESETSPLEVSGTVEIASTLTLNDSPVTVNDDGSFLTTLSLTNGFNNLYLQAEDEAGNIMVFNSVVKYTGQSTLYGDVNGDSSINITDAVLVLKYITNPETTIDTIAADVNADNSINITDAVLMLKYITNPTIPFPTEQ